jgi:hypothetical protein
MTDSPPDEETAPPEPYFDNLVRLLVDLATKVDYHSEAEQVDTAHLLRHVEEDLGVTGIVPPERSDPGAGA